MNVATCFCPNVQDKQRILIYWDLVELDIDQLITTYLDHETIATNYDLLVTGHK